MFSINQSSLQPRLSKLVNLLVLIAFVFVAVLVVRQIIFFKNQNTNKRTSPKLIEPAAPLSR